MKKHIFLIAIAFFLILLVVPELAAQCPMCKLSAETNLQSGGTAAKGLNKGILYLLSMPYVIVAFLGYTWYKNRKKLEFNNEIHEDEQN